MDHLSHKGKNSILVLTISLLIIPSVLACSLSNSVIEAAIARTEAALPTLPATAMPTPAPSFTPTFIPTFTPVIEPVVTVTPLPVASEPKYDSLWEALVSIDQLVQYLDENFKIGAPDFEPLGLGNDCEIECAGRWISGKYDTFELIIELNQETSESSARAAVDDLKDLFTQSEYTDFPPIDWDEYELPGSYENAIPDNYYAGLTRHPDFDEAVAVASHGPVLIYITMIDYERGWADYPNILLQMVMTFQTMNLKEMRFE